MSEPLSNHDFRNFRFSRRGLLLEFRDPCLRDVINSDAFKRLASIHFLGSIDFLISGPRHGVEERHTRYEHSLAVGALAQRFGDLKNLPRKELRIIVVSALLHDIGHAPLSHSLEPAFKGLYEIDHHLVGERILRGEVRTGLRLSRVLKRWDLNNFEIMSIISGVGEGVAKELFARAINVDTIEGILRSASYIYRRGVVQDPLDVMQAFATLGRQATSTLDEFWMMKDRVYSDLIQSPKGLVADYICKKYMEQNAASIGSSYYYGTEAELRRSHVELFDALEDLGRHNKLPLWIKDGERLTYQRRRFHIDTSVVLRSYADIDRRYLQSKGFAAKFVKKSGGDHAHNVHEYPESERLF